MAGHDWLNGSNSGNQTASGETYRGTQPTVRHELRPLTTGEVLDRTFYLYRSNFWLYVGISSIAAAVNVLVSIGRLTYLHFKAVPVTSPDALLAGSLFSVAGLILYFAVYSVTHAATVSAVSAIYMGEQTSMGKAFAAVKGHWLRYCLIALWQSWSAGWIFVLMIVPVAVMARLGLRNLNGLVAAAGVLRARRARVWLGCVYSKLTGNSCCGDGEPCRPQGDEAEQAIWWLDARGEYFCCCF